MPAIPRRCVARVTPHHCIQCANAPSGTGRTLATPRWERATEAAGPDTSCGAKQASSRGFFDEPLERGKVMKTEAISHLVEEHREIGRVLDAFENFLRESRERCKNTGLDVLLEPRQLWAILDYLSEHLLMRHEEKEELCVLPALARHGLSWSDTDLQHTRQE